MSLATRTRGTLFAALYVASMAACATQDLGPGPDPKPPVDGHAFLEIVGDRNVFIGLGARATITVKYHDDVGGPLIGEIAFAVVGDAKGSAVSAGTAQTDRQGLATIDVNAGSTEASFNVRASATYATAVDWSIGVRNGPPGPQALSLEGTYQLESQFDLVAGLPGTLGEVVRTAIDITNDPNDPTTFLIDLALRQIDNSSITGAVNSLRPGLDVGINQFLKDQLGDVYANLLAFGNGFGDAAQRFGLKSELAITKKPDGSYVAKHTVKGIFFFTDAGGHRDRQDVDLAEMSMDYVVSDNVPVTRTGDTGITIGDHALPVSYGKALVYMVRNIVIALIDPWARNLTEFLQDIVDCDSLGEKIAEEVGFGSAGIYSSACKTALAFAGNYLEGKLGEVGGTATGFSLHGNARIQDSNSDKKVDKILGGEWEGRLDIGPDAATLARPKQTFLGNRLN
jgi:hypothetical protein